MENGISETSWSTILSSKQSFRIFVVDDEIVIANTLAMILRDKGYAATCFTSPLAALAAASMDPPDLLLSDVAMAELCGIELAIAIKESGANCKFLLLSGQAHYVDLLGAARARGYDFPLHGKPIHPLELLSMVEALLQPWTAS